MPHLISNKKNRSDIIGMLKYNETPKFLNYTTVTSTVYELCEKCNEIGTVSEGKRTGRREKLSIGAKKILCCWRDVLKKYGMQRSRKKLLESMPRLI